MLNRGDICALFIGQRRPEFDFGDTVPARLNRGFNAQIRAAKPNTGIVWRRVNNHTCAGPGMDTDTSTDHAMFEGLLKLYTAQLVSLPE
ncbi:MAG: hypothetical protein Hens3KO_19770 [Henriciella sp.]